MDSIFYLELKYEDMKIPVKILLLLLISFVFVDCTRPVARLLSVKFPEKVINVKIDEGGRRNGPCEPSICIDPSNPQRVLAGAILDRVFTSEDGGMTWAKGALTSSAGVYGDPVVRIDNEGTYYYGHLSNPSGRAFVADDFLDRIVIQRSQDHGQSWNGGTWPEIKNTDHDKHWLAIDPKTNDLLISWTEFDKYQGDYPEYKSRILFSVTKDKGESWSPPQVISENEGDCADDDFTTEGAVPAIGANGEYYVSWAFNDTIYFDRSLDKGKTWLAKDKIVTDQPGGWAFDIPGISRCNGMPITEVDLSDGRYKGRVYVNWSDQRNGEDDTDVWLAYSDDQGNTWSSPIRVNDDPKGRHQFFTWMDVDPVTGIIYIVFYDRRAYEDNQTDVYLAYSINGGQSFVNKKISESPFDPDAKVFFGDYNDISAYDGVVRPIWTRMDNKALTIWTAIIDIK